MNVLHVVNSLEIGGLEKVVVNLTQHMDKVTHTVVCLTLGGELIDEIAGESFVLNNSPGLHFSTIMKIKKIIHEKSIDIVHTHNQGPQFYGSMAAKLAGKAVIHTKHGQNSSNSNRRDYLDRFSSFLTDIIVTVSDDAKEICYSRQKIPDSKLVTVLNGVDTNCFYRFADKSFSKPDEPFVIGTVSRLSTEKNHACLLASCALLVEKNVAFKLIIVGDGPLRKSLEMLCKELKLEQYVFFAGLRMDIAVAMNEFDLFVLPSLTEGISLTLLEAMSCELPVVATMVGGTPEVVIDGETGALVESDNPQLLAEAINGFICDSSRSLSFGIAGRSRIEECFSIRTTSYKYYELYNEILVRK